MVRSCQREAFVNEFKALVSGKPTPPKGPLTKLNPVLNKDDCIRSNGRLQFDEYLTYDVRFPKILGEDNGLQSSLSNITMSWPIIQQVLILCCPK